MSIVFPIIVGFMCFLTIFIAQTPAQEAASVTMFMVWSAAAYVVAIIERK